MVVSSNSPTEENSKYVYALNPNYDSSNIPLDLSKTSPIYKFVHQSSTSDENCSSSPMDLSNKVCHTFQKQMSIDESFESPLIITEPKSEWHYRSLKDLAKKHIPFLSGIGPQRTPIRIRVPEQTDSSMYLGISVVTHDGQFHDSKIIVPPKTKVKMNELSHDNNLQCLNFDECFSTDYFHPITRCVYLAITPEEHKNHTKEVRVHMLNLYQNQTITKDIIEAKRLDQCRLSFWLCFCENGRFTQISPSTKSSLIQEKKISAKSRYSQNFGSQINHPHLYPTMQFISSIQGDDDEDDSECFHNSFSN